jgi:serine/threonine protein kinase
MLPFSMLDKANDQHRLQFFERVRRSSGREEWTIKQQQNNTSASSSRGEGAGASSSPPNPDSVVVVVPSTDPIATLTEVIRADSSRKKKYPTSETGNSPQNYELFVDLIHQMLSYDPRQRIRADDALNHPFITEQHN